MSLFLKVNHKTINLLPDGNLHNDLEKTLLKNQSIKTTLIFHIDTKAYFATRGVHYKLEYRNYQENLAVIRGANTFCQNLSFSTILSFDTIKHGHYRILQKNFHFFNIIWRAS